MLSATIAALVLQTQVPAPKIDDLRFMTGPWVTEKWGGLFEELWMSPADGTMQGVARLRSGGKTTFMEFMSIETGSDGRLRLWIVQGEFSKGPKKPEPFLLSEWSRGKAKFERDGDDFPSVILYEAQPGGNLKSTISGIQNDKPESEVFNFKRPTVEKH